MDEFDIVDNKDKFSVLIQPIVNQNQREEIQQRLEEEFNLKKTSIKIHLDDPSLQEDMHAKHQARVKYGFIISGAPVESDEYVYAFLDNIIQQATEDCRKIQQLTDKQLAYVSLQQYAWSLDSTIYFARLQRHCSRNMTFSTPSKA